MARRDNLKSSLETLEDKVNIAECLIARSAHLAKSGCSQPYTKDHLFGYSQINSRP